IAAMGHAELIDLAAIGARRLVGLELLRQGRISPARLAVGSQPDALIARWGTDAETCTARHKAGRHDQHNYAH
ncbi:MAG: hypothetical protein GY788_12000, partial [bacterium]|nr:hypothetical protein [bacterium]